jgi:hypothetical protein
MEVLVERFVERCGPGIFGGGQICGSNQVLLREHQVHFDVR